MQTTWILVADSSRARIFEIEPSEQNFQEVEDFFNPQGRANGRELNTDSQAREHRDEARPVPGSRMSMQLNTKPSCSPKAWASISIKREPTIDTISCA
jgi:protein required for attachment to host cells